MEDTDGLVEKLRSAGFADFTKVVVDDQKVMVHCTHCGTNIAADMVNLSTRGLKDFKQHVFSELHLKNAKMGGKSQDTDSSNAPAGKPTMTATIAGASVRDKGRCIMKKLLNADPSEEDNAPLHKVLKQPPHPRIQSLQGKVNLEVKEKPVVPSEPTDESVSGGVRDKGTRLQEMFSKQTTNPFSQLPGMVNPIVKAKHVVADPEPTSPNSGDPCGLRQDDQLYSVPPSGARPRSLPLPPPALPPRRPKLDSTGDPNGLQQDDDIYSVPPSGMRPIRCPSPPSLPPRAKPQWQYMDDTTGAWTPMAQSQTIEKDFCQVEKEKCLVNVQICNGGIYEIGEVDFKDGKEMTLTFQDSSRTRRVRRHTTTSSTKWKWSWLDENNKWREYGSPNAKNIRSKATVDDVENAYKMSPSGHFPFTTDQDQSYDLDFSKMEQTNVKYKTTKKVRRRPEYVEYTKERNKHEPAGKEDKSLNASYMPPHWDIHEDDERVKYVQLEESGEEYKMVEALFKGTMSCSRVASIKRVQSMKVFDAYDRERTWVKRGGDPKELSLFHGTTADNIKIICEQGFDWRICGSRTGTLYGKGTYFGVTARVASSYAQNVMLVCKVLVGDSCKGNSGYLRPPPKDPGKPKENLYDSCVDNMNNPTMYILFKSEQAYPEYIIEYH